MSVPEMLMGLNSLEFNLCLRGADLDRYVAGDQIEWSVYFQRQLALGGIPATPAEEYAAFHLSI
jgi:hypothetical protein